MTKATTYEDRFKEILSDPSNAFIPRVPDAGKVENGIVTMHNGLKVYANIMANSQKF